MASESIAHEAFVMGYWLRPIRAGGIIVNKRLIGTLLITRTCIAMINNSWDLLLAALRKMSPRSFLNKKRRPRSNNSCVKPSRGGTRPELRGRRLDCLDQAKVQLKGPRWVLATKKMSLLLKEPRAIIETSMAGVNDFIGLTNLKCCAPALLKGRMENPMEHAGHISTGYATPHLSALRVTRTASW